MNFHRLCSGTGFSVLSLVLFSVGCQKAPQTVALAPTPPIEADDARLSMFKPALPAEFTSLSNPLSEDKIQLGRMLYFDKRLSKNHDINCNSCHDLSTYGADGKRVSLGHKKQPGTRNSPTVFNSAGQISQFWDGRSKDVEDQAGGPMMNPVEMAMPAAAHVEKMLRSIDKYVELFKKAFPGEAEPVTLKNTSMAIGAFERRLNTPGRWDKFLGGDKAALTAEEKMGLAKFVQVGCITCHTGTLLGGTMYQKTGLIKPWPNQQDQGRFTVTGSDADQMVFKVPTLRNVEKTAPYFHDGSIDKLEDAVRLMARHQLGRELTDGDTASITAFLRALSGTVSAEYTKIPELPPNGSGTPAPDPT